ncbi:MAG: hypothetical protein WDK95_13375 [Syntrophorhabdaceae bacterium]
MKEVISLIGTMPEFRELYPNYGAAGKKMIIKNIKSLYLDDCLLILSKLSRHYHKYINNRVANGPEIYRKLSFGLLDDTTIKLIEKFESDGKRHYIIFPEISILYLVRLCLKNCNQNGRTLTTDFKPEVLHLIGKSLLLSNSVMNDCQSKSSSAADNQSEVFLINFTKQLIADRHVEFIQKMYYNYFLFRIFFEKYNDKFNIESVFLKKYGVGMEEYFSFLYLLFSQFLIKPGEASDHDMPFFNLPIALRDVKIKFNNGVLKNYLINKVNYNKIDDDFFNYFGIVENPLVKLHGDNVIPLNYKYFVLSITDGLYFDIYNFLNEADRKIYSTFFGQSIENYFQDIIVSINKKAILSFEYKVSKETRETPDAVIVEKDGLIMFECKKRQFHTSDFLKNGDKKMYLERINEFFYKPLNQLGKRIKDLRDGAYKLDGYSGENRIYPIVICPISPPIFSGAWGTLNLAQYAIPDYLKNDPMIAEPEFIDFEELECIEEYLRINPTRSIIDLIKIKRSDPQYHNGNWMIILQKNGMALINKRLRTKYQDASAKFKNILF